MTSVCWRVSRLVARQRHQPCVAARLLCLPRQGGAATKTDTRAEVLRDSTTDPPVDFVLRIVAALRAKPKA